MEDLIYISMEDRNNSFVWKGIILILFAATVVNIYRTEEANKQLKELSDAFYGAGGQQDPDFNRDFPGIADAMLRGDIATLQNQFEDLRKEMDAQKQTIKQLKTELSQKSSSHVTTTQAKTSSTSQASSTPSSSPTGYQKVPISVQGKVKVENRYVNGKLCYPALSTGYIGTVVVGITINIAGNVSSAKINSGTTITDEDILDACKEAALKTRFSINTDSSNKHPGTITYTFTER